jgi:hypothetical protein
LFRDPDGNALESYAEIGGDVPVETLADYD